MRINDESGYTLVELVVVAAVTFSLLLVVLVWVQSLSRAAGAGVNIDRTRNDGAYLDRVIADDLTRATTCRIDGRGTIFASVTADGFDVYADVVDASGLPTPDGVPDLVRWTFATNEARRGVVAGDGTCPIDAGAVVTVPIVSPVFADGAEPVVTGYLDGTAAAYTPECASAPESCVYDAVAVRARIADAYDPAISSLFAHRYLIDVAVSRG